MSNSSKKGKQMHKRTPPGERLIAAGHGIAPAFLLNPPLSYPRQAFGTFWVPSIPRNVVSSSGVMSTAFVCDATTRVNNWGRFSAFFDEYRILKIEMRVRASSTFAGQAGIHVSYWDEINQSGPTSANAVERIAVSRPNDAANAKSEYKMTWSAQDPKDLEFQETVNSYEPVTFKAYSDTNNFGLPNAVADVLNLQAYFLIQFRGLKGN